MEFEVTFYNCRFLTKYKYNPNATSKESFYGYKPEKLKRLFGFIPKIKDEPSSKDHNSPPFFVNLKNDMGNFRYFLYIFTKIKL